MQLIFQNMKKQSKNVRKINEAPKRNRVVGFVKGTDQGTELNEGKVGPPQPENKAGDDTSPPETDDSVHELQIEI